MPNEIPYKSFCWALGTTSFRTKDFNKTIEEQLALLDGFWALPEITERPGRVIITHRHATMII